MSKVSIILISYNEKAFLPAAVESVARQSLDDVELIIGDDGSNDGSIGYIETLPELLRDRMPVRYYVMDRPAAGSDILPSVRVSENVKRGLSLANSDYVVILSGDDRLSDADKLKEAADYLDVHPEVNAFVSGYRKTGLEEKTVLPAHVSPVRYFSVRYLHISCFVFRKILPDTLLDRFSDDTGLEFSLAKKAKWAYSDKVTFEYVQRGGSIMHDADELELSILEAMIFQDIQNDDCPRALRSSARSRMYRPMLTCFQSREKITEDAYGKFLRSSAARAHDYIGMLSSWKQQNLFRKAGFLLLLFRMGLSRFYFRASDKIRRSGGN